MPANQVGRLQEAKAVHACMIQPWASPENSCARYATLAAVLSAPAPAVQLKGAHSTLVKGRMAPVCRMRTCTQHLSVYGALLQPA